MNSHSPINLQRRRSLLAALALSLAPFVCFAQTNEVRVMISGGFSAAYQELTPRFERETGIHVITVKGPSMGKTAEAIPNRLARGEDADVLIMVDDALQKLIESGHAVRDSRKPLANSAIAMAVKTGAPQPDISTPEALKRTLLAAKSVAYSDSASGVYIGQTMFARMGIAEQMAGKSRPIPGEPVARVVARGEAELGFQQLSELLPVPGVTVVGKLPAELQKMTLFSAGIASKAKNPEGARKLLDYLSSPQATPAVSASGLEPVSSPR